MIAPAAVLLMALLNSSKLIPQSSRPILPQMQIGHSSQHDRDERGGDEESAEGEALFLKVDIHGSAETVARIRI